MPRSYDVTPTQITHHPTQRIDPVPGRLPDVKPEDLVNGFAKAMKILTGVDITSTTAFFQWLKGATGLDFVILGQIIDSIVQLLGIDPDNPVDIEAQWAKIKDEYLDPISDFLTPDSPLNGANLFGLLDIPFVMLRNSNQELLENPTFFGELSVGNRRRWSHVTDVYRKDADPPGAELVVCNGELTAIRSNRGRVAEGQMIVGEIHVLGDQVASGSAGSDLIRLQLIPYLNDVQVGTPVTVGLTSFTLDPTDAGWVGAPNTALAGRLELDWTVPAGVDEVELRTEVTGNAASGRVRVDSGSLQRGFNWNRVERDLEAMLGILDGVADPDTWEAASLGLKDLLSLVGIDTSGWVTSTAFAFWRDFNTNSSAMVRVFAHLGSAPAWEDAWDGLRGLADQFGVDTSDWPDDLDPGGLVIAFATLTTAGNALFKDLANKAKWTVAWDALRSFVDKLLGEGTITWPDLVPGGWFVDALAFVQGMIGETGRDDLFPKGAGGVVGQVPTGLKYTAQLDLGGSLPSGNLYYCVTAMVDGVESPPSAEVLYFAAGLGTVGMKVKLEWDAFSGASQYRVFRRIRSVSGDVDSRLVGTAVGTTFTDSTVRSGGSAATPPLSVSLAAQAAAEAAAAAAAAANNALVVGADSSIPNAPTFGLLQGAAVLLSTAANSVPYPGLLELPIFYYYTVTAVTAGGKESVASAEKFVMVMGPAQVKLSWTASTTPSTTYRVYRRSSKTGATVRVATGIGGTTFTDGSGSGTTVATPGTTTAVAGSAVATAKSTASAAQAAAEDTAAAVYDGWYGSGGTGDPLEAQQTILAVRDAILAGYSAQGFSANGTWSRPVDCIECIVVAIGCGIAGSAGQVEWGGQGGLNGGYVAQTLPRDGIPESLSVTVGATSAAATTITGTGVSVSSTRYGSAGGIVSAAGYLYSTSKPGRGGRGGNAGSRAGQDGERGEASALASGGPGGRGHSSSQVGDAGAVGDSVSVSNGVPCGGAGGGGGGAGNTNGTRNGTNGGAGGFPGGGGGGGGAGAENGVLGNGTPGSGGTFGKGAAWVIWKTGQV